MITKRGWLPEDVSGVKERPVSKSRLESDRGSPSCSKHMEPLRRHHPFEITRRLTADRTSRSRHAVYCFASVQAVVQQERPAGLTRRYTQQSKSSTEQRTRTQCVRGRSC